MAVAKAASVMCYNVRVWMMVENHMLVPSVGQININHHHHLINGSLVRSCADKQHSGHHRRPEPAGNRHRATARCQPEESIDIAGPEAGPK